MAYTKTNWQDLPNTTTPINATNLNKIENQLETNTNTLDSIGTSTSVSNNNITVSSGSVTNIASVTLQPGKYLLIGSAQFSSNATGYRQIAFGNSATETNRDRFSITTVGGAGNARASFIQVVSHINISTSTSLYLNALQNSGVNLTVASGILVVRLS